jgi:hypothetical protein
MKNKPLKEKKMFKVHWREVLLLPVLIFLFTAVSAQEAIPVSGGNASGEAGSLSYSVGQAVYTTVAGAEGIVAQGVQQPYEISALTGTHKVAGISLEVSAYPNPAADYLILNTGAESFQGNHTLEYRMYDMNSKLLHAEKLISNETTIAMGHLMPSVYFVKIINGDQEIKSFKIIKK